MSEINSCWVELRDLERLRSHHVAEFHGGRLFLEGRRAIQAYAAYPHPCVCSKTEFRPRWRRDIPVIMDICRDTRLSVRTLGREGRLPMSPVRPAAGDAVDGSAPGRRILSRWWMNRQAFRQYWSVVPGRIRKEIARFSADFHQWRIFRLCSLSMHAVELCESNPGLALALALHDRCRFPLCKTSPGWASFVLGMIDRPRREILEALEFPGHPWVVRLFSKIEPSFFSVQFLFPLRSLIRLSCRDERQRKRLCQIPVFNNPVLKILRTPELNTICSARFLEEVGQFRIGRDDSKLPAPINHLLDETVLFGQLLNRTLPCIDSLDQLVAIHDDFTPAVNQRQAFATASFMDIGRIRFPPPPFPGDRDIQPILNPVRLAEEGRSMSHCCLGYAREVETGTMFFYSLWLPERATVALARTVAGWVIHDIRGERNRRCRPATWRKIRSWLDSVQEDAWREIQEKRHRAPAAAVEKGNGMSIEAPSSLEDIWDNARQKYLPGLEP